MISVSALPPRMDALWEALAELYPRSL
jgi:hypothetical protein